MIEWICQEEQMIRSDGATVGVGLARAKELVRCKDCKHYRYYGLSEETVSECRIDHAENQDGNWFCAGGEREEDDRH